MLSLTLLIAKPFVPENPERIVFTLEESKESQHISMLLKKVKLDPHNLDVVDELLSFYINRAKKKSDVSYMGYAQAFLVPYLKKYPDSYFLKMHQIDILQYTHQFNEALNVLNRLTSSKGMTKAEPYLVKATIYQAIGDYNASLSACKKLLFRASHLLSATCLSNAQSHLGKLESSYLLLKGVYKKAKQEDVSEKLWALTTLSDMAYRMNDKEKALAYLEEALALNKDDYYALKKMSDIYLEEGKYTKVKTLLEEYHYVESLLLRQSVARAKLGEELNFEKENLSTFLTLLSLRNEKPHAEDVPYFKELGLL